MNKYNEFEKPFIQGYVAALSHLVSGHGAGTEVREGLGIISMTTIEDMLAADIDPYDITILTPVLEELRRNKEYSENLYDLESSRDTE